MTKSKDGLTFRDRLATLFLILFWLSGLFLLFWTVREWTRGDNVGALYALCGFIVCVAVGSWGAFYIGIIGLKVSGGPNTTPMDTEYSLHLVRCEPGREEEVAREVMARASSLSMSGFFSQAVALTEKITEIRQGVKHVGPTRYVGLVSVKMIPNTPAKECVLATPGVKDFVNQRPLSQQELDRLVREAFEV